jgi:hypothetical protein
MNLFRSEGHVKNWSGFKSGTEDGIVDLSVLLELFSVDTFTKRLDRDYVSHMNEYRVARTAAWSAIMKKSPFWSPKAP